MTLSSSIPQPWTRSARFALCILLAGASGCQIARTIGGPQDEYVAYRRVRTSTTVVDRLKASNQYLETYPSGRWMLEVRPWFQRAEAKFFSHREETPQGLQEYLQVLPTGPHAAEARRELERHRARVAEGQRTRLEIDARYTEARLAELEHQRQVARDTFGAWVGRLLAIESWGEPTPALDHEFIYAWRIEKPSAKCVDDRCWKLVELPFAMPGGGEQALRELDFEVVLVLQQGMLHQAALQGPGMFSRLYEATALKPVLPGDSDARTRAIAYAIEFLGGAAEARMPASRCAGETSGDVIFKRACDGWSIEATAPADLAADDTVVVQGPSRAP